MGKSKKAGADVAGQAKLESNYLDNRLQDLLKSKHRTPECARDIKIGDTVTYDSNNNFELEVLDIVEKRYLLVRSLNSNDKRWEPWLKLIPKIDTSSDESLVDNTIMNNLVSSQRQLDALIHFYYEEGITLNPSYQRGHVWTEDQKVLLVDSLFNGIDLGKFVFAFNGFDVGPNENLTEIIDGKQRLSAIIEFYEDRFPYKGKLFSQLKWQDRSFFLRYLITYGESKEPLTEKQKIEIFLRLNAGGTAQTKEHMDMVREKLKTKV